MSQWLSPTQLPLLPALPSAVNVCQHIPAAAASPASHLPCWTAGVCCAFAVDGTLVIDPDEAEEKVSVLVTQCGRGSEG